MRVESALLLLLLLLLAPAAGTPRKVRPAAALDTAVNAAGRRYVADQCHVGLSITAVVGSRTRFYNFGTIQRDRLRRPTPDSVYELASVTKTFIGALAARALVDGRMTLDGDFRKHLPGSYPNLALANQPLTLRALATHTSGLQRDLSDSDALLTQPDYDRIGGQLAALNKGFNRTRTLDALRLITLRSVPGDRVAYSNIGIRVIGYGLESVYREPLARLLRQSILDPLGMPSTGFMPSRSMRARLVIPYGRSGRQQPYHDASAGAAYGLYSTPRDMARYLRWQLKEADPIVAQAHASIRGIKTDGDGLIWHIGQQGGEQILWHGGGSFGQTSQMVLFPSPPSRLRLARQRCVRGQRGAAEGHDHLDASCRRRGMTRTRLLADRRRCAVGCGRNTEDCNGRTSAVLLGSSAPCLRQ